MIDQTLDKSEAKPLVEIKKGVRQWIDHEAPDRQWLFDGLLHKNSIALFDGLGSAGKSLLSLQLSLSLAAGLPFLDFFECQSSGKVLYLDAEDPANETHRRGKRLIQNLFEKGKHGLLEDEFLNLLDQNFHNVNFLDTEISPRLARKGRGGLEVTELFLWIKKQTQQIQPDLIVIDPLVYFCSAAESDNETAVDFYSELRSLKTAVLILTHHSKAAMNAGGDMNQRAKTRGASALTENARAHLSLENEALICDKNNYCLRGKEKWKLDMIFDAGFWNRHGEPDYDAFLPVGKKPAAMKKRSGKI